MASPPEVPTVDGPGTGQEGSREPADDEPNFLDWSRELAGVRFAFKRMDDAGLTTALDALVRAVYATGRAALSSPLRRALPEGEPPDEPPHDPLRQAWPWIVYTTAYGMRIRHATTGTELDLHEAARKLNDYDSALGAALRSDGHPQEPSEEAHG